ncbi:glutamate--cysteine ligase [Novimethylophilus kurashikiensis]|uniref:Glutamate--cysteine ligase n=1 Tax=Novimethylophilus kurashikiensis TaxID=1825523 RepID=A0A2R5FB67_9PROT|nr:glutamate--cysteine ligase [Novimethylophilus kurashikiensis]GBG13874.1 glutamate--cysteine ligase [Novimethylophilus kurashikiensis]
MVPHLTTAQTGPLLALEQHILDAMPRIEHWLRKQWLEHGTPFYASVDLRNSGFKLAPVDTNLFPGGFNNLSPDFGPLCIQAAMAAVEKICPDAQRFMLIPENHTRNGFYLENVAALATILRQTGLTVRIGSLIPDLEEPLTLELPSGGNIVLEPVKRKGNRLVLDGYDPCAVILNNDLSGGIPEILQNIEQSLIPPLKAGWAVRRKSSHFAAYNRVAEEFGALIGIDPWLVNPYFSTCHEVNFQERTGEECLAAKVDELLGRIREKYRQYEIDHEPFVIVKANAGTYGMGIMTVKSPDDVRGLNRKQRNKMAVIKEGMEVSEVIIQEGVYTFENINDAVAEPVVYMIDHYVVGGFYRVHTGRGIDENLNAPGMHFEPLAFETPCSMPDCAGKPDTAPNRFYAYGVVARLALLAASLELETEEVVA